ncbi:MAG: isoprenoid biosynthesis glyoxalase ElbB [Planctomycetota bacterium]
MSNPKKVCVILSGCGFRDGAEIHESVIALLAIERHGAVWHCCAPNVSFKVVDHRTGKPTGETRNVLTESARIARGRIDDIAEMHADGYDALVMPGGSGAAGTLSDFLQAGSDAKVHPQVDRLIREFLEQGKPVGAICIAPATLARAVANAGKQATLTVGNARDHADAVKNLNAMAGVTHADTAVSEACIDEAHRIATTPAYMIGPGVKDIAAGIEKVVAQVLTWA